jgi:glyoxylase-like metal-dependent hydrolase (beta-lactamase superfamily II)/predicted DCC family thiol-disulfide oxidoreductase YuxK
VSPGPWRLWYDDQCEVCQAGVAWLRWLDGGRGRVEAIPLSACLDGGSEAEAGPAGVDADALLRHLHARAPDGRVFVAADAVAGLARLFRPTAALGWLATRPGAARVAAWGYDWIARHRYSLSRCRGGACRAARVDLVRERASWRTFQACRVAGWAAVTPLALAGYGRRLAGQAAAWWQTRGRTARLLDGRLAIHFLGGGVSALVPLLFGERFTMIRYGALLVDPGGSRMARSVARHLRRRDPAAPIAWVAPTHAHEEHAGNLALAARLTGAAVRAPARALPLLARPPRIPRMRRWVIGQPSPLAAPVEPLGATLAVGPEPGDVVHVVETPGHCIEHAAYYAPRDRLLLAGDSFMGTHFSSPNDDVDHDAWQASLERLAALDVEILVEAHGHVHTERADVLADLARQGLGSLASPGSPRARLAAKLDFVRWVAGQVRLGRAEGLPARDIQATIFPWTQRWSYEAAIQDRVAAALSGGEFGRHKVVRSFRPPPDGDVLPTVYEVRWRP